MALDEDTTFPALPAALLPRFKVRERESAQCASARRKTHTKGRWAGRTAGGRDGARAG